MANYIENFGLSYMRDSGELISGLIPFVVKGEKFHLGYGGAYYSSEQMGDVRFIVRSVISETDKTIEIKGIDAHTHGFEWDMIVSPVGDITSEDEDIGVRLCMVDRAEDGKGAIVIDIINADVLPSLLPGDYIKLRMIAFAFEKIHYYPDDNSYVDAQPKGSDGQTLVLSDGMIFPSSFLYNRNAERDGKEKYYDDSLVQLRGTVVEILNGTVLLAKNDENNPQFIRCIIDTQFGRLEIVHTKDQVPETEQRYIKVGAIVGGLCVLSGDAAINEYKKGAIYDKEHNLRVIRQALIKGDATRTKYTFELEVIYNYETLNETSISRDKIVEGLQHLCDNTGDKLFAHMARIISFDDDGKTPSLYKENARCIVVSKGDEYNYDFFIFIDVNNKGKITKLFCSQDNRYHFSIDSSPKRPDISDALYEKYNGGNETEASFMLNDNKAMKSASNTEDYLKALKIAAQNGEDTFGIFIDKAINDAGGDPSKIDIAKSMEESIGMIVEDYYKNLPTSDKFYDEEERFPSFDGVIGVKVCEFNSENDKANEDEGLLYSANYWYNHDLATTENIKKYTTLLEKHNFKFSHYSGEEGMAVYRNGNYGVGILSDYYNEGTKASHLLIVTWIDDYCETFEEVISAEEEANVAARSFGWNTWDELLAYASKENGVIPFGVNKKERNYKTEMASVAQMYGWMSWEEMERYNIERESGEATLAKQKKEEDPLGIFNNKAAYDAESAPQYKYNDDVFKEFAKETQSASVSLKQKTGLNVSATQNRLKKKGQTELIIGLAILLIIVIIAAVSTQRQNNSSGIIAEMDSWAQEYGHYTWEDMLIYEKEANGYIAITDLLTESDYKAEREHFAQFFGHESWEAMHIFENDIANASNTENYIGEEYETPNDFYDSEKQFPSFDKIIGKKIYTDENITDLDDFAYFANYPYNLNFATEKNINEYISLLNDYGYIYDADDVGPFMIYKRGKYDIGINNEYYSTLYQTTILMIVTSIDN